MARRKVLVVRPALGAGGAEQVTVTLLRHLDRARFESTLALVRKEGVFLVQVPPDVKVHDLRGRNLWLGWIPLARLLRRERPDVVLSLGGSDVAAAVAWRMTGRRGRLVLSERNTVAHSGLTWKRRLMIRLKQRTYPIADTLIAVSEGVKADMVRTLGIPPERITVIYNPIVDQDLMGQAKEPVAHPWFGEDVPIVLGVGRLTPQKDFATLMRAFRQVRKSRTCRLVILGEGPLRGELEGLARELEIEGDVWLPGFDRNPFKYMARCSVFVLSSRHEGLPGVLIQAMACGAPVVSTDCPYGPAEIIEESGRDGILVPVGDVEKMSARINDLLDLPDERQQIGERARESAERFTVSRAMEQFEQILSAPIELGARAW
ncbi:MAG: glycosyltransferase [Anaerolineae bacterium]|nr:glycosyltransferase [Anaerolineae bacterium]